MTKRHSIAAFALAAALAAGAAPASAQTADSFDANLEAIGPRLAARAAERAQALRECNGQSERLTNYTWGSQQLEVYRACMARHGQPE